MDLRLSQLAKRSRLSLGGILFMTYTQELNVVSILMSEEKLLMMVTKIKMDI